MGRFPQPLCMKGSQRWLQYLVNDTPDLLFRQIGLGPIDRRSPRRVRRVSDQEVSSTPDCAGDVCGTSPTRSAALADSRVRRADPSQGRRRCRRLHTPACSPGDPARRGGFPPAGRPRTYRRAIPARTTRRSEWRDQRTTAGGDGRGGDRQSRSRCPDQPRSADPQQRPRGVACR